MFLRHSLLVGTSKMWIELHGLGAQENNCQCLRNTTEVQSYILLSWKVAKTWFSSIRNSTHLNKVMWHDPLTCHYFQLNSTSVAKSITNAKARRKNFLMQITHWRWKKRHILWPFKCCILVIFSFLKRFILAEQIQIQFKLTHQLIVRMCSAKQRKIVLGSLFAMRNKINIGSMTLIFKVQSFSSGVTKSEKNPS